LRSRRRHERHDANVPNVAVEVGPKRIGMRAQRGVRTGRATTGEKAEKKEEEKARLRKTADRSAASTRGVHPVYFIETSTPPGVIAEAS
jgi:hypothetical protein